MGAPVSSLNYKMPLHLTNKSFLLAITHYLVDVWHLHQGGVAHIAPCDLGVFRNQLGARFLEELAVLVVVLVGDVIVLHNVVVEQTCGGVNCKATTISHSHALRHFYSTCRI